MVGPRPQEWVITVETIRPKSSTRRKIIEIASIFAFIIIVEFWAGDETVRWGARYLRDALQCVYYFKH
jgi:hypothetical protein